MFRYVRSKWIKTEVLLKNDELKAYIPTTLRMTSTNMQSMLQQYSMVYIKPDIGTFGNGVMRVELNQEYGSSYQYQLGVRPRVFKSFESMYSDIIKLTRGRSYLVQKGIHLLKYRKRRFDIRIMVQKNLHNKWESTGWIGRLAHPHKIVTNYHSGGTPMAVELLLASHLKHSEIQPFIQRLQRIGVLTAKQLQRRFPGLKEIGVDVAIDYQFKPWILEVNTKPDPYIFKRLPNKMIYAKIIRYVRKLKTVK